MEKLQYDTLWTVSKILFNSTRHRILFNMLDDSDKKEYNLRYMYLFPIDNETEDKKDYTITSKMLYDYFDKKNYLFTQCQFNGCPSPSYSWNTNSIVLLLPEWINFSSVTTRTRLKLSNDIAYINVFYGDDLKNTMKSCFETLSLTDRSTLSNNRIVKAILNEYENK